MSDEASGERLADALKAYYEAEGDAAEEAAVTNLLKVATRHKLTGADAFTLAMISIKADTAVTLKEYVKPLLKRVGDLEAQPKGVEYLGTYTPGVRYSKNNAVTSAGSLWIATTETLERPGDGVTGWRLAVKRGRDGRDAA